VSLHWLPECWSPSSSSCPKADWKGYLGHRTELALNGLPVEMQRSGQAAGRNAK